MQSVGAVPSPLMSTRRKTEPLLGSSRKPPSSFGHQNLVAFDSPTSEGAAKLTVSWLQENGDRPMDNGKVGERTLLRDSVGVENWDKYIREMSQHGVTWGDEATLLAASVLFPASVSADSQCAAWQPRVLGGRLHVRLVL